MTWLKPQDCHRYWSNLGISCFENVYIHFALKNIAHTLPCTIFIPKPQLMLVNEVDIHECVVYFLKWHMFHICQFVTEMRKFGILTLGSSWKLWIFLVFKQNLILRRSWYCWLNKIYSFVHAEFLRIGAIWNLYRSFSFKHSLEALCS